MRKCMQYTICDIREKFFNIRPIIILYCCLAFLSYRMRSCLSLSLSILEKKNLSTLLWKQKLSLSPNIFLFPHCVVCAMYTCCIFFL